MRTKFFFYKTASAAAGSERVVSTLPIQDDRYSTRESINMSQSPRTSFCRAKRKISSSSSSSSSPSPFTRLLCLTLTAFVVIDLFASPAFLFAAAAQSKKKKKNDDEAKVKSKCTVCRSLVNKFMDGLEKTKKSGYGGGNTAWEERSLGRNSFAKSETRFVEIMERVCDDVSGETEKFYCSNIVEEQEEDIEAWYQSLSEVSLGLEQVLCVQALKVCCPHGSYGQDCTACTEQKGVFCNGRGECKGNGTRVGDGKCDCQWPYKGEICAECESGYFHDETKSNESHIICEKCDEACGGDGCDGPQASHCLDCATGYQLTEADQDSKGCVDIDECAKNPCQTTEFCTNSVGSYSCNKCDQICDPESGCTGGETSDCVDCRAGAEWDADRKNCVVTDWQIYDDSLKEEKEENADGDDEGEEVDGEDPAPATANTERDEKAEAVEAKRKLEEPKAKLQGGREKRESKTKVNKEAWEEQIVEPSDSLFEESVIEDDDDVHDEL